MHAIVLSGGGAKGAYEAGVACTLFDKQREEEPIEIICGTSIGAINAAFLAQGQTLFLAELWKNIAKDRLICPIPRVSAVMDILDAVVEISKKKNKVAKLKAFFDVCILIARKYHELNPFEAFWALTGTNDPENIQKLLKGKISLAAVECILLTTTTNLISQGSDIFYYFPEKYANEEKAFKQNEQEAKSYSTESYADIIRASSAIPGLFSPIAITHAEGPASYVDGGVINNTPIGQAIDAGATKITVIYLDPETEKKPLIENETNIAEILMGCFGIMQQRILALDYKVALRVNEGAQTSGKRVVRLRTIRPKKVLPVGLLDFDKQPLIDQSFAQGVNDAQEIIDLGADAWQR